MKRTCLLSCLALTAAISACTEPTLDEPTAPDVPSDVTVWSPTHHTHLRWNAGYVAGPHVERGTFALSDYPAPSLHPPTYEYLWSTPTTTVKGYAVTSELEVFAYRDTLGLTYLQREGVDYPVLFPDWSLFAHPIEEIEIHPVTHDVYALSRVANAIRLYRLRFDDSEGVVFATALINATNGTTTIFHNPSGNNYRSGSICFVHRPTAAGGGAFRLAFMNESSVYQTYGLMLWMYDLVGDTYVSMHAENRTYAYGPGQPPGGQTGNLNIAYDLDWSRHLYFARDNGNVFQYDLDAASNSTPAQITTTPVPIVNDMGHWDD